MESRQNNDFGRLLNSPSYGAKRKMSNIYSDKKKIKISHEAPEYKGKVGFLMRFNNDDTAVVDIIHGFSMKRIYDLNVNHIFFMHSPINKIKRLFYMIKESCNEYF